MLDKIIEYKRQEIKVIKEKMCLKDIKEQALSVCSESVFGRNISRKGEVNLIAEIKKRSPSKGVIRPDLDPQQIAWEYQNAGAVAISVLTDERFFDGDIRYIKEVKDKVDIPVLRKDFIIDEYQIYEAVAAGADAILLISRVLDAHELASFLALSRELGS